MHDILEVPAHLPLMNPRPMIRQAFLFLTLSLPAASAQVVAPRFEYQDCNANGIADLQDILLGTSEDCQGDGIPDECQLAEPYTLSLIHI